jgi:preprotein translocase subunit SecG
MLIAAAIALFFIVGMFLSMLSSSPKKEAEWNPDTQEGTFFPTEPPVTLVD